jgi:outer membrane murein-binding lipoprotein Lpp
MTAEASDLIARLDALSERVKEARAAAEVIAEGDASAAQELDAEIDRMAQEIAALKGITGTSLS